MATIAEDKYADTKEWLASQFELFERMLNGRKEKPFHELRKTAIGRLGELPFPTRRDEDWKYTSVRRMLAPRYKVPKWMELTASQIEEFLYPDLDVNLLVFVNGIYQESLSEIKELPDGAAILPLEEGLENEKYADLIRENWVEWVPEGDNPFTNLNAAFGRNGLFIHVPANVVIERPIHLLHINVPVEYPQLISPQNLIIADRSSQVTVLESIHVLRGAEGKACLTNQVNRMIAHENAVIRHYKVQNAHEESFLVNNTTVDQHRDSTYSSFIADLGGRMVRNNINALLQSEGTLTNLYGIFLGNGEQHVDNQTYIDHAHPHCQSNELYKGILTDRARGVFNGKVLVRQDAQKTNAFQQNSTLVLSEKAQMDSKPQLEIFADDVRCSHGATIGQLEEDAVFYLRSRGLTDLQARALLQHAFIKEVIEFIPMETVRQRMDDWVVEKFAAQWK